jgi:PAS domain-containing protein
MPRIKLQIVYPFAGTSLGRSVITWHDIKKYRSFVRSLNRALRFVERNSPQVYASLRNDPLFINGLQLKEGGRAGLIAGKDISFEDIELDFFRPGSGLKGPDAVLLHLNRVCQNIKVGRSHIEFALARSEVRILLRGRRPIDLLAEERLAKAVPNLAYWMLRGGKADQILESHLRLYTEEEIFRLLVTRFGRVSRHFAASLLTYKPNDYIRKVMRPHRLEGEGRNFVLWMRQKIEGTVPIFGLGEGEPAIALKSEVDELIGEKRLYSVLTGETDPDYFVPELLALWRESGSVVEVQMQGKTQYLATHKTGKYLGEVFIRHRPSLSAGRVLLDFLQNRQLSQEARHFYPLLAAAIEVLSRSPRGTDPYFEAARLAAERKAPEESLTTILLSKGSLSHDWQKIAGHLDGFGRKHDLAHKPWDEILEGIKDRVAHLEKAAGLEIGEGINAAGDLRIFMQRILNALYLPEDRGWAYLEHFALVLGRLKARVAGTLIGEEEKKIRVAEAPLAEMLGYDILAAQIRDEVFRLTRPAEHQQVKQRVEAILGLTYREAELHLQDTADLIREALAALGISSQEYEITVRVKTPYSAWEKMQNYNIEKVGWLHDLLGISVVTKDDRLAYRLSDIIKQILPELSPENYDDQHGLLLEMGRKQLLFYSDEIAYPKKSGFSAITLMRLTDLKLPVEVQITTHERDKVNRHGKAAHWKLKFKREVEHFYPAIKGEEFGNLTEFDGI